MMKFLKTSGIYLLAGLMIFAYAFVKQGDGMSPKDFKKKMEATTNPQLVDVRTADEFAGGYIPGAKNIDWNSDGFETKIAKLDKSKPTFVYCHSGKRSAAAAKKMKKMGFTQVHELSGGITGWEAEGLPLTE